MAPHLLCLLPCLGWLKENVPCQIEPFPMSPLAPPRDYRTLQTYEGPAALWHAAEAGMENIQNFNMTQHTTH